MRHLHERLFIAEALLSLQQLWTYEASADLPVSSVRSQLLTGSLTAHSAVQHHVSVAGTDQPFSHFLFGPLEANEIMKRVAMKK